MKQAIENFARYRYLLFELVKKGIKIKYRRSYLGLLWTLLEPLLTMIVLTIVFGTLFGNDDPFFSVYILAGRLIYTLFSQSTTGALKSIQANASMIKKVYVPKYMYPLSSILYNYVIFLLSLIVLVVVAGVRGVKPTWHILEGITTLCILLLLSFGVGMILATIGVFFRDMEYLWNVGLMLIMYACAIFYYPEKIMNSGFSWILRYNPLYCLIENFRNAVFGNPMNIKAEMYALVFSFVTVIIGVLVFRKKQDNFILHL